MELKNLHKCFLVNLNIIIIFKKKTKTCVIFLSLYSGEFDQPETIWSNEMRRLMIEKIALHIGKKKF